MTIKSINYECSVIIMNKNLVELLKNCLESIERHTQDVNYELIVVDALSADGSRDYLVTNWANRATLIFEKDKTGYAESSNKAFKWSSGKYIYLLNNDCEVHSKWLRNAIDFTENKKNENNNQLSGLGIGLVASLVLNNDKTVRSHGANLDIDGLSGCLEIPYGRQTSNNPELQKVKNYAYAGLGLLKRKALVDIGYTPILGNRLYYEDSSLGLELWRSGYSVTYCPSSIVTHIYHPSEREDFSKEIEYGHAAFMNIWGDFLKENNGFHPDYPLTGTLPYKNSDFIKENINKKEKEEKVLVLAQ